MVHSPYPQCTTNSPRFKIITSSIQETLQVPRSIVFHSTRDHKVQNNYNPASHTCTNKIQSPKRNYVSQNMSIATGTVHVSWRLTTTMQTTKNGSIITGLYLHNMHEKNKDLFQQILHMPISEQLINLFANIVILVTLQWHIYEKSTTYYHSSLAGARITFRFKLWSHSHNSFSLTFAIEIKANRFKLLSHSHNSFSLTFAIEIKANRFKLLSHSHNSFSLSFAIEKKSNLDRRLCYPHVLLPAEVPQLLPAHRDQLRRVRRLDRQRCRCCRPTRCVHGH